MTIRQHDPRAGLIRRGGAGQNENAGPDDRADAEQRQVEGRQRSFQRLAALLDIPDELLDRFRSQ